MINFESILNIIIQGFFLGIGAGIGIYFGQKLLLTRIEKISKTTVERVLEQRGFKIIEK